MSIKLTAIGLLEDCCGFGKVYISKNQYQLDLLALQAPKSAYNNILCAFHVIEWKCLGFNCCVQKADTVG